MDLLERAKMANVIFVYLFVENATDRVIYVGTTRYLGRRFNEHRRDLQRKRTTPLYIYMRTHNLELFKNVHVRVVGYTRSRVEAAQMEADLIARHKDTVTNLIKYDTRRYCTDPRIRKVRCVDTGEVFPAVIAACERYGLSRYKLTKAIKAKQRVQGHLLEFYDV